MIPELISNFLPIPINSTPPTAGKKENNNVSQVLYWLAQKYINVYTASAGDGFKRTAMILQEVSLIILDAAWDKKNNCLIPNRKEKLISLFIGQLRIVYTIKTAGRALNLANRDIYILRNLIKLSEEQASIKLKLEALKLAKIRREAAESYRRKNPAPITNPAQQPKVVPHDPPTEIVIPANKLSITPPQSVKKVENKANGNNSNSKFLLLVQKLKKDLWVKPEEGNLVNLVYQTSRRTGGFKTERTRKMLAQLKQRLEENYPKANDRARVGKQFEHILNLAREKNEADIKKAKVWKRSVALAKKEAEAKKVPAPTASSPKIDTTKTVNLVIQELKKVMLRNSDEKVAKIIFEASKVNGRFDKNKMNDIVNAVKGVLGKQSSRFPGLGNLFKWLHIRRLKRLDAIVALVKKKAIAEAQPPAPAQVKKTAALKQPVKISLHPGVRVFFSNPQLIANALFEDSLDNNGFNIKKYAISQKTLLIFVKIELKKYYSGNNLQQNLNEARRQISRLGKLVTRLKRRYPNRKYNRILYSKAVEALHNAAKTKTNWTTLDETVDDGTVAE
ncbi:MAG: hypothetical protein FD145_1302 [Candidatus Saganbacteria bacterium]|uniref:Uncharacterized protein n=1 Tax=Candidatus Saganbacteria bacterium TaxID=2575572 RepID=A0A833L0E1_UNCSA|nr:MAG: hypothetical protein FD145_1302 [Candidatus Saganbacteria bacterium]